MKFCGTLISVSDMEKSKNFYEKVMEQEIGMDLGVHVSFVSGLALQSNYEELVGEKLDIHYKSNNFQLYFEVEDLDCWEKKLKNMEGIEFIHQSKEYPWGQRVMRFYDFDMHIVEVSESMMSVAKRFLSSGLSVEEIAERMMSPVEYVKTLL
jgi:predicted enzyme related to lactoylglutathione lyase